jgi:hypothetical protein
MFHEESTLPGQLKAMEETAETCRPSYCNLKAVIIGKLKNVTSGIYHLKTEPCVNDLPDYGMCF